MVGPTIHSRQLSKMDDYMVSRCGSYDICSCSTAYRIGYAPNGSLSICTVIEEECTPAMGHLHHHLKHWYPLHVMQIPKLQSLSPNRSIGLSRTNQMGVMWFRASVTGKPCHVLQTSAGSNAIEGAFELFSSLKKLEERYNIQR